MKKSILFSLMFLLIFPFISISSEYGNSGLFHLFYASSLPKDGFTLTLGVDNLDRKKQDTDINDFYFSLGYGLTDKLEIGARLNFLRRVDPDNLTDTYYNGTPYAHEGFYQGIGYADLGIKYSLSENFAVRGFFSMPLSSEETATTTTKPSFGGNLIVSTSPSDKGILTANVGYIYNSSIDRNEYILFMNDNLSSFNPTKSGDILSDSLVAGVGGKAKIFNRGYFIGEGIYETYLNSDAEQEDNFDMIVGFQFLLNEHLKVNIAYKKNLLFNENLPTSQGGCVSIVYSSVPEKIKKKEEVTPEIEEKPEQKPEKKEKKPVFKEEKPVEFKDVYFAFDEYYLTKEAKTELMKEVEYLKENPDINIVLEGHTCNIGTNAYNLALGENRAKEVKGFLLEHGIDDSRIIKTISYGEENPKYDNTAEETRRFNRRAFIRIKHK